MDPVRHARIKEIFAEARSLVGSARRAFLDGACAGDAALRSEVEALLASEREAADGPLGLALSEDGPPGSSRHGASESTRFGRYEVEGEVARGGMGVIYRVRDPEMRRFLALKVLRCDVADGDADSGSRASSMTARFTDEAQLTGQLDHPGIIPVYDMGQDEEGRLFFTMRLVKGRTLEEIFELVRAGQGGWTVTRALGVLQKVCEAMAFAHDRGVIHRDLKPANVMVGRFGETYVMDWGLAKLIDGQDTPVEPTATVLSSARKEDSSHAGALATQGGDVMGTPTYMAPEQARGELQRVGPRSDVYSLGAMLYHLLAASPPYRPMGESSSAGEVLSRLLAGPPPPVDAVARAVPPELCAICARAMAREPEARYGGMLELAEDLQAYVENRVVQAYRRGALVEFRKWVQRNRAIAASLAAVFAVVIAGLVSVSYVQTRARQVVETKNRELAATNVELEAERRRTAEARDRAEQNRERALESERVALANEEEALWQSYVGNVGAAYAALEVGSASEARRRLAACPEELRGWEWRYLDQRADASLRLLTGSETFVTTLAVSPAGPYVAAAGGAVGDSGEPDFAVRVWDFATGELRLVLERHADDVTGLAFSPAGDTLASSDARGTLRLWDVESGALIAEVTEDGERMGSRIAYHPDGRLIASAAHSGDSVTLWDSYERVEVGSRALPAGTNQLRFSPDGTSLALAGRDDHVRVLDLDLALVLDLDASGEAVEANRGLPRSESEGPGVYAIAFSPDGHRLVSGSDDGFLRIFDLDTGERVHLLAVHDSIVLAVAWHPRFDWIASSGSKGSIRFWDAVTGRALDVLRGHDEDVHALGFTALGDRLLSASRDQTVRVWDGQAGANDTILEGLSYPNFRPYYPLDFSPDGERVAWRRGRNALTVTDVRTGEDRCSRWTFDPFVTIALRFAEDGVWSSEANGRLARWDPETGEQTSLRDSGLVAVHGADFPRGGRSALVAGVLLDADGAPTRVLRRVDLATGEARWTTSLAFYTWAPLRASPDGTRCVVRGSLDGEQILAGFDATTGALLWQAAVGRVHDVDFFPDGARLAYTTYNEWDDSLYVCDARTGELSSRFTGHAQPALLDVSPDGSRVVTANWDGTISLWSPERGEILALPGHEGNVTNVAFSPDGQTIASLGMDGLRRLWSASSVESRQAARRVAALRRRWTVDARRRVEELFATRVHAEAVVQALEADRSLGPEQRDAAILAARARASELEEIVERALAIALEPGRTGAEYLAAMEGAELALERVPTLSARVPADTLTDIAVTQMALGTAQLRLGLYREALASLELAERTHALGSTWTLASVELLRSMAHHHLGEAEQAAAAYERGSSAVRERDPAVPPEIAAVDRALELEARALLGRD